MSTPQGAAPRSKAHVMTWMTVGTVMIGLSGFVFLSVIGHGRFNAVTSAALSSTYLLVNILGPGVFAAIEQETSRTVSHTIAIGAEPRAGIRRMLAISAALSLLTLLVLAALASVLLPQVLDDNIGLLIAIGFSVFGSALIFLVRGIFGGQSRFGHYAWSLMIDGGVRLAGCTLLAVLGNTSPSTYAVVLSAGPMVASLVMFLIRPGRRESLSTAVGSTKSDVSPAPSWSHLTRGVLGLLISSVLWMSMSNLAPVIVTASMPAAPELAAGFTVALVLTRISLLMMAPIQALFLPRLSRAVATLDTDGFRRDLLNGLMLVLVLGAAAISGFAGLGPLAIRVLFGEASDTNGRGVLALLAVSSVILMLVLMLQPALVALRQSGRMVAGWVTGTAVFIGCFILLPMRPLDAAIFAQLAGPATTLIVHIFGLTTGLRSLRTQSNTMKLAGEPHPTDV